LATERRTSDGGTTGVWTDITERKQVEEALRAREEQLQLFITHAPVAVAMFDRDMRFIVHSRRWVEDFDLQADDIIGRSQYEVFPETPEHWVEAYQRCLTGEVERCDEESIPRADGTLWWLRWEMHPWRNASGEISGIVSFIEVINDRKKTEAQLIRSQRMEAVGQLTGGVAHEFNNLLHIIQSYAFLLAENAGNTEKTAVLVEPIQNAANRGRDLVKRLLSFSRRQLLQPKTIDLGEVALDLIELIRPPLGETIELVSVTSENLWPILVDQGELENALLNLALNSRDAMPNGGKLTITTENHSPRDSAETEDEEDAGREYVRLSVTDSGEGMTPETREQAFEPFFTTKGMAEHSGLGLSMVHGFVSQSGGYVVIDSKPGEGTTVSLYLPRV
jgi:PAS domain S-box-containing protein